MRVNELVKFIKEREKIRVKKESGRPRPWTSDPILGKFRFCNVHREDDRVTRWLRANWYPSFEGNPDVWFAAIVARLFNNPEALDALQSHGCILPFKPEKMRRVLHDRKNMGFKNFNAAYIVSTNGVAMDKVDYIVLHVLQPLWKDRRHFQGKQALDFLHALLTKYDGMGSFIAGQVVADLKYIPPWNKAPDWWTFAASGPGSRRGLNRVVGYKPDLPWKEAHWARTLEELLLKVNKKLDEPLHAQDLQNCLCEFDKYERARLGEGTPKQIYKERVDD